MVTILFFTSFSAPCFPLAPMSYKITKCTLNFFFRTLHWLLISFTLHITGCAVEQLFHNILCIVNFGSVFSFT